MSRKWRDKQNHTKRIIIICPPRQEQNPSEDSKERAYHHEDETHEIMRAEVGAIQTFIENYVASNQQSTDTQQRSLDVQQDNLNVQRRSLRVARWAAGVLFVYTAVTALLWCATREASRIAQQGVEVTRRSVEISQRAWIIANEFAVFTEPPQKEDITIPMPLVIENSGKTPALYIQGKASVLCTRNPQALLDWPRISYALIDTQSTQLTLGPGQKTSLVSTLTLHPDCHMGDVLTKQIGLIVFGYMNYWDEFGTTRGLVFCGEYSPKDKRFQFCGHDNLPW